MNNLQKILNFCIERKESCDTPALYCEDEYYTKCEGKSEVLDEVINEIYRLIKEEPK
jgi:hypothetical protein